MPLLEFWKTNPEAVGLLSIRQIVSAAGDGRLADNSTCSDELRKYLKEVPTARLSDYVEQCLSDTFEKSGFVLQDLTNELGSRLDYRVTHGLYQGRVGLVGYDGIWRAPDGISVIVEVKTTDAYRMSIDTLARYRFQLIDKGEVSSESSILIVVGREDTGELEAQIRGSRHAWDVRLISAEALLKLVRLRQTAEGGETARKIRDLLAPAEYTRLDRMVEVMFTTAKDLEEAAVETVDTDVRAGVDEAGEGRAPRWQVTDGSLIQEKRSRLISAVEERYGVHLEKATRALYGDKLEKIRVAATISKRYADKSYPYWYAYHPQWDTYLSKAEKSFLVLGCIDLDIGFAIPTPVLHGILDSLNVTVRADGERYRHIHIVQEGEMYSLLVPRGEGNLALEKYKLQCGSVCKASMT